MHIISKSKYVSYKTCPKSLWLIFYKKEEYKESLDAQKRMADGHEVGEWAKKYFKNTVDVSSFNNDESLNINKMIELTNKYLKDKSKTIAEASFNINGMFCSVDLLHPVEDGYEIYEVKATTDVAEYHKIDVAYQKYILEQAGLKIVNIYIMHLNNGYRRHGEIELENLFIAENMNTDPLVLQTLTEVKYDSENIEVMLEGKEPKVLLNSNCKDCPFREYCLKDVPVPSVLSLPGNSGGNKYDRYNKGVITYQDVLASDMHLSRFQKVQIESYLNNKDLIVDKEKVKEFLNTIKYPIYHLDFETIQLPIPPCDDAWPYEQIPTQYSLHIEYEDGKLEHKEFLGTTIDPRREIAESLCENIPMGSCMMAFNKKFERDRLNELAELYPDLRDHLLDIRENAIDLAWPFQQGYYYHKDMFNRYSIKLVLPALFPNDPELDYHALPLVHNGGEAMNIYPKMLEASKEEKEKIRDGLLKYCYLDTYAMVKILRKIKEMVKN